ncbi:SusC/RagA family TonB-linked outer membrane protein [Sphingobacterium thalpophilum]|uniref:TonB-linked outer membrane protein, SusC/RagA family n=1 Tax=Sphingobacterium thalpophilum TaxID=259 RepID=A0A4V6KPV1_9SPHI|nr:MULTISPECIES: SusC/RagA family TonB-linked outer membrane protein [Sphingobacterium]MCW8310598.1 SusC/RagA family TonB-linked outer membrane protein [Sphingobacterium sp. InxBP1]VTR31238.1 TonB-linked outer membrane protein, SusC/RagA family [Sphingobacterium thalpophilum]
MKRTNTFLKLVGCTLLLQSLAFSSIANQAPKDDFAQIISRMEKKLNIKFGYDASIAHVPIHQGLSLDKVKKETLASFIHTVSNGALTVERIDDTFYLITAKEKTNGQKAAPVKKSVGKSIQQQELRGLVLDQENGSPLAGVTIRVKGGTNAATTGEDGSFVLRGVTDKEVLQISYVGYQSVDLPASSAKVIRLVKSSEELGEVVVTALGIKREQKALGYATQSVKGEELTRVKGVDVGTTLTGRVSGVRVLNSSEFNSTPEIQVRGLTPLLVIDGVSYENMTLRDVPVDNIQDMTILKGATATALYGSKGSGGAIMITTKKGLAEKGTEITVNTNNMFFSGYLALPEVQHSYSAGEGGQFNNNDYVWGDKLDIGRRAKQWNPITKQIEEQELTSRGKNNFKNFLEPGFISNNTVSFTTQGEHGSVRTSINHIYNKGQYPNQKLNLTNISVTGTTKLSDKVDLEARLGYNRSSSSTNFGSGYNDQGYIYNILVWTGPEYDLRDYKDYWLVKDQQQNWMYKGWYDNPYLIAYEKTTPELINKMNAALTLNYKLNDWAKFMVRSGYDYQGKSRTQRNPIGIYGTRGGFKDWGGFDSKGKYMKGDYDAFSTTNDFIFTAKKNFGNFGIDGLMGGSIFYRQDNNLISKTVNGLSIPGYYSLRNSIGPVNSVESRIKEMRNGIYGRLSLSWRNAVFVEATGRNDWSSTLPQANRSYFYPSVSGSVVVSDFLSSRPAWLDLFKVRGSWAVTKSVLDPYEINRAFTMTPNVWDGLPTASYPNLIKDYSISPTQRNLTEFGFDFGLLRNRLYGNYTRYYRLLKNEIIKTELSETTGFTERLINTREQEMTKGHEITLGGTPIKREDFQWDMMLNFSQNMRYFHQIDPEYSVDALYVRKGLRADYIAYSDWEWSPDGQLVIGDDGLPVSAQYKDQVIGYTAPKWFWGFSNQFRYKDFSFSLSIDGRIKGMSYSTTNDYLWNTGAHVDSDTQYRYDEVVNGKQTFIAPGVKITSGSVTYDDYGRITEDTRTFAPNDQTVSYETYYRNASGGRWNYWDETFIKLRELSLNYRVPEKFASKLRAKRASVGITGQNLLLWSKEYRFSDPDRGKEDLNSPSMRYIGFNLNLTF